MGLLPDTAVGAPAYSSAPHHIRYYSVDAGPYAVAPAAVAFPATINEVVGAVRRAVSGGLPVTARGGGTGLVGGSLGNGVVLDMSAFGDILPGGDSVRAGAGVFRGALDRALEAPRRFFAPNPSVGPYCTVGGMVANNSSGSRSLKYGSTIDNLEEVTLVDGRGDVVTLPQDREYSRSVARICRRADLGSYPDATKNSCGYRLDAVSSEADAHRVVAASEGTLGVIVSAKLRTFPVPRERRLVVVRYRDESEAARDCPGMVACAPSALEMIGPGLLEGAAAPSGCVVFAEFDTDASLWRERLRSALRGDVLEEAAGDAAGRWWRLRNASLSSCMRRFGNAPAPNLMEDATVPVDRLPELFDAIRQMRDRFGAKTLFYGHAGNGNIHLRVAAKNVGAAAEWYLDRVMDLRGTITGEHGDGVARTGLVLQQYGEKNHSLFVDLKRLFDPRNVMNPGKVVEERFVSR